MVALVGSLVWPFGMGTSNWAIVHRLRLVKGGMGPEVMMMDGIMAWMYICIASYLASYLASSLVSYSTVLYCTVPLPYPVQYSTYG